MVKVGRSSSPLAAVAVLALAGLVLADCGPVGDRPQAAPEPPAALAAAAAPDVAHGARPSARPAPARRPHLLFVMIDTLRPDHLGAYGYERATSPFLDAFAERGVIFLNAYSVAPWTNPAIASLFTGRHPQAVFPAAPHREAIGQVLPAEFSTLAEHLQRGGYRTIGLVDHPGISPKLGYDRGFDVFVRLFRAGGFDIWSRTEPAFVLETFVDQLDRLATAAEPSPGAAQPRWFIYLHLVYPHRPYMPSEEYAELFGPGFEKLRREERSGVINRYDGEIRQTDALLAALVGQLEERRLLDETAILITSDHGEGFWEHGFDEHGKTFYDETIKIPLILVPPGGRSGEPARVATPVSNIDLFPTVLELAGIPLPDDLAGRSLLRFLRGDGGTQQGDWLFSESPHSFDIHGAAAISPDHLKFVSFRRHMRSRRMIFDLEIDPEEEFDLEDAGRDATPFATRLAEHRAATERERLRAEEREASVSADTLERLRALGYTETTRD